MTNDRSNSFTERCLRQYRSHTHNRADGSLLVRVEGGLYDLFQGHGFKNVSRFRVVKLRSENKRSLIQISGVSLTQALRHTLLEECQ